jgi:Fe-S-cluster-containing dehydrogenase component/DMSO reductase anchor subunit
MTVSVLTNGSRTPTPTLIENLLAEQAMLTAVEAFSKQHARGAVTESRYRALLPATAPAPGQQYAFEVDLDRCSGCKACVTACHSLNGLDEDESWRSVGLLVSPVAPAPRLEVPPVQQHVTTACHHCVDPACLNGCPVLAYDKDPVTGIVRHLDDQCIGCSYCVMKCPYEVPRYSDRLGIVRKCDMCSSRLAVGEPPACAQACPSEAIRIVLVDQSDIRSEHRGSDGGGAWAAPAAHSLDGPNSFLPDSPDPAVTLPSTRFVSRRALPGDIQAADHEALRLEPAHDSLVIMLVLTQAAAGIFAVDLARQLFTHHPSPGGLSLKIGASSLLVAGLMASVLHLGHPTKAWRSFLGWRRSWLSREIIALNLFAACAAGATALDWLFPTGSISPSPPPWIWSAMATVAGLVGVTASSMVYIDTGRPLWRARITFGNFFGSTLLLGAMLGAAAVEWLAVMTSSNRIAFGAGPQGTHGMALAAILASVLVLAWRVFELRRALAAAKSPVHWNGRVIADLLDGPRRRVVALSLISLTAAITALAGQGAEPAGWLTLAAAAAVTAELMSRRIYFRAGGGRRMPGGAGL